MHSRIFQFEDNEIHEDDCMTEDLFYDDFVGTVADYIDGDTDIESDIEWLVDTLEPYGIKYDKTNNIIIFRKDFKYNYFKPRFKKTKEIFNELTFNDFIDVSSNKIHLLQNTIDDKHSFYIFYNNHYRTLDSFIRDCLEEDKEYYVGNTIDYHY